MAEKVIFEDAKKGDFNRKMEFRKKSITIGARTSRLSQKQVEEVLKEIQEFFPEISFQRILVQTTGDKDLKTSLRTLDKSDFFTREIDSMLLEWQCRIAIHSAKDLGDPLPEGLALVALTRGVDPSDVLVFRNGGSLSDLPRAAKIGSSAARRDEAVREIVPDAVCLDIRGTIDSRLAQLDTGEYDAVVMAEAALIRLGLTHRRRLFLPGVTAPLQGRLAVIARSDDMEMKELFSYIHAN